MDPSGKPSSGHNYCAWNCRTSNPSRKRRSTLKVNPCAAWSVAIPAASQPSWTHSASYLRDAAIVASGASSEEGSLLLQLLALRPSFVWNGQETSQANSGQLLQSSTFAMRLLPLTPIYYSPDYGDPLILGNPHLGLLNSSLPWCRHGDADAGSPGASRLGRQRLLRHLELGWGEGGWSKCLDTPYLPSPQSPHIIGI